MRPAFEILQEIKLLEDRYSEVIHLYTSLTRELCLAVQQEAKEHKHTAQSKRLESIKYATKRLKKGKTVNKRRTTGHSNRYDQKDQDNIRGF